MQKNTQSSAMMTMRIDILRGVLQQRSQRPFGGLAVPEPWNSSTTVRALQHGVEVFSETHSVCEFVAADTNGHRPLRTGAKREARRVKICALFLKAARIGEH